MNDLFEKRPLILDGAMGTMIQRLGNGVVCNEEVCLSNPKLIWNVHLEYIAAGSEAVFTNTFGATSIVLSEYGLSGKVREINVAAAKVAREAASKVSGRKVFVIGDVGPTSKLVTLGHIAFDELYSAYREQIEALVDGGVDAIVIETCQDILQAKAAIASARWVLAEKKKSDVPVIVSVTIEKAGAMLLGTELEAAITAIAPYCPAAFGINCAAGPADMKEELKTLQSASSFPIHCKPNAGMPETEDGKAVYKMSPEDFGEILAEYVWKYDISSVGGCCGTTPEHIRQLAKSLSGKKIKKKAKAGNISAGASSLYTSVSFDQVPRPFVIAEQTNVNGSKSFKEFLKKDDFIAMAEAARVAASGSHAIDVCLAMPGRNEESDFENFLRASVLKITTPVMIDSTNIKAIEAALKLIPGRAIINSINLEDGGAKAKDVITLAKKFGAAVVALTIDEEGMAKTVAKKIAIAERLVKMALDAGLSEKDIFIDFLTFTLASGDLSLFDAAVDTLCAIKKFKKKMPDVRTVLGVSNVSFGLPAKGRKLVTSVFLKKAIDSGLDAAIINPVKVVPYDSIPKDVLRESLKLIDNDRSKEDPLKNLISMLGDAVLEKTVGRVDRTHEESPEEELKNRIIIGNRENIAHAIERALGAGLGATEIINDILLPAMKEVGLRFGAGKLPLPFVLESAETMRAAVHALGPYMSGRRDVYKGTIVIATVRGDVHDIGKNLVDVILSGNGFKVVNLGIRQPASAVMEAVRKNNADAVGLSGLLVSSTEVMKEDLSIFKEHGIGVPVLCGGAALTSSFVKNVLAPAYGSSVVYCADAFSGLVEMERIADKNRNI